MEKSEQIGQTDTGTATGDCPTNSGNGNPDMNENSGESPLLVVDTDPATLCAKNTSASMLKQRARTGLQMWLGTMNAMMADIIEKGKWREFENGKEYIRGLGQLARAGKAIIEANEFLDRGDDDDFPIPEKSRLKQSVDALERLGKEHETDAGESD